VRGEYLAQHVCVLARIAEADFGDVDAVDAALARRRRVAAGAAHQLRQDAVDVVVVEEADAVRRRLAAIPAAHGVRVHQPVARRERRTDQLVECAVDDRETLCDVAGLEGADAEVNVFCNGLLRAERTTRRRTPR
jgi:hypothetical protein